MIGAPTSYDKAAKVLWEQRVAGSNPAAPTNTSSKNCRMPLPSLSAERIVASA